MKICNFDTAGAKTLAEDTGMRLFSSTLRLVVAMRTEIWVSRSGQHAKVPAASLSGSSTNGLINCVVGSPGSVSPYPTGCGCKCTRGAITNSALVCSLSATTTCN